MTDEQTLDMLDICASVIRIAMRRGLWDVEIAPAGADFGAVPTLITLRPRPRAPRPADLERHQVERSRAEMLADEVEHA